MPATHPLRLAELLTARLCHELIGPIGAIGNGVELLCDDGADFLPDAVSLIGASARRAANRLQFYRFAYGFAGGTAAGAAPRDLAAGFFEGTRIRCDYPDALAPRALDWHKLACNLLLAGAEGLPRGGSLCLATGGAGLDLEAAGDGAALPPETCAGLTLTLSPAALTSRTVHAYFTGLLAEAAGCRLAVADAQPGRFRLLATPL